MLGANSFKEGWAACRKAIGALPTWALVAIVAGTLLLVLKPWILGAPLMLVAAGAVVYVAVKRGVLDALREHDLSSRE
jgi:hypothetical protein